MHYAPQILLFCTVWISVFTSCLAKEPPNPELLKKFTKDVESVLSPTLVDELQGAQSNRSAVNVEQTAPRNPEQSVQTNDKKPEIQFNNQVYPYHYERSYHYQYPPNPQNDPARFTGYSENFYEPRFRPKSHLTDSLDPTYYRSELYNPFGSTNPPPNSNLEANSNTNVNTANNGDVKQTDNSGTSEVSNGPTPVPPNSFAHPDVLASPPQSNPFPSPDLGGYRPGAFGRPLVDHNYFRPNGDAGKFPKNPSGHYLPQGEGRFTESFHQRPIESYQPLPPLDSFQNYPSKEFQGYNEQRPSLTESTAHRSQHLSPPFLGSFFPPGYQSPFYSSYRPSEYFNSLFSDNFTRNFPPLRSSFGGFYPHHNYLPPPPSPSPSTTAAPVENKPEETGANPIPPGGPSSQPIPTAKPADDTAPVAAASNSQYQLKLFFPTKDDVSHRLQPSSSEELTFITKSFRF